MWRDKPFVINPEETGYEIMNPYLSTGSPVAGYCDGGVIGQNPSSVGATWAFCLVDITGVVCQEHSGVVPVQSPGQTISNNIAELYAMLELISALPDDFSGSINCDSFVTVCRIFHVSLWRDRDGISRLVGMRRPVAMNGVPPKLIKMAEDARARIQEIRNGGALVEPVLLQGHPTREDLAKGVGLKRGLPVSRWNVHCDELCTKSGVEFVAGLPREGSYRHD